MALSCAAECALSIACARWALRRLSLSGADDSASWPTAAPSSFAPIPRACRAALAAYDEGPAPCPSPLCPPYRVFHDRAHGEVVLAVRGLGLGRLADYRLLLDAGGPQPFAGGHAHRGLLRAAVWLLGREGPALQRMVAEAGPGCRLVFVGHSLGAGIAALAAVVAVRCWLGRLGLRRGDVRCYALAPPRCISLGIAVEYADVVHSVVLQDDFLPRTPAPLQHIFGSIFCLPCLLGFICMRDTLVPQGRLTDLTKLYAPGRVFHIVERKNCRCGRFPPEVKTAVPVEGRFEHVVLSCNATSDHAIIWIEREAQKALDFMDQAEDSTTPPSRETMDRVQEQPIAMKRATSLHSLEHLLPTKQPTLDDASSSPLDSPVTSTASCSSSSSSTSTARREWDELVETLLHDYDDAGDLRIDDGRNVGCVKLDCLPFPRCR